MQVHHLSHIDLDGYGSQLVSSEVFSDIVFYNANYGKEVEMRLNHIIQNIKDSTKSGFLLLITDLNLTINDAQFLQNEVNLLNMAGKNVKLQLLDHHITGKDCAESYGWYHLDSSICASKITFEHFKNDLSEANRAWLKPFVDMINAADTWLESDSAFGFGKVAMGMIAGSKEFSRFMFDDFDREFKLNMLRKAREFLLDSANEMRPNGHIELDNNIFLFKKSLLGGNIHTQTMDEILSLKQSKLLTQNKIDYTINFEDKKGLLTYMVGGISVLANLFLTQNSEYDFFMDISNRGNVSLRSNGKCDVSELSKRVFNGGGHKNAAGGKFDGFKETFIYTQAKEQVMDLFAEF